jgi:hypothetical protein
MAVKSGLLDSFGSEVTLTMNLPNAAPVTFSAGPGVVFSLTGIALTTSEAGATIRYTLDGSAPTTASTAYTGPLNLADGQTLRAAAFLAGKVAVVSGGAFYAGIIPSDPAEITHVFASGGALRDVKGLAWNMVGTVPIGAKEALVGWANGRQAAPLGAFSDVNYFSLGTGIDALDFLDTDDFVFTFVMKHGADGNVWFSNGLYNSAGYYFEHWNTNPYMIGVGAALNYRTPSLGIDAQVIASRPVRLVTFAKVGSNMKWKVDAGAVVTAPLAGTLGPSGGAAYPAYIGRYNAGGYGFTGRIYEIRAVKKTVTDAELDALHAAVLA